MVNSNQRHKDISLILIASFFYMTSPMLITPIITGFSESLGASGTMMGLIGGIMNICSLISRPIIGVYADKINKYKISSFGIICIIIACIGYTLATNSIIIMIARIINGPWFCLLFDLYVHLGCQIYCHKKKLAQAWAFMEL